MATFDRAVQIAAAAHAGQVDKEGQPYLLHVLRVALAVADPEARIAAVLHDVVEDTARVHMNIRLQSGCGLGVTPNDFLPEEHPTKKRATGGEEVSIRLFVPVALLATNDPTVSRH